MFTYVPTQIDFISPSLLVLLIYFSQIASYFALIRRTFLSVITIITNSVCYYYYYYFFADRSRC